MEKLMGNVISLKEKRQEKLWALRSLRHEAYALVTDLFSIGVLKHLMLFTWSNFLKSYFQLLPLVEQYQWMKNSTTITNLLTIPLFFAYFFISYQWGEGQTLGALVFNVQAVVKSSGHYKMKWHQSSLRSIGYLLGYLSLGSLYLVPFFRKDRQGIYDLLSQTMQISTLPSKVATEEDATFSQAA